MHLDEKIAQETIAQVVAQQWPPREVSIPDQIAAQEPPVRRVMQDIPNAAPVLFHAPGLMVCQMTDGQGEPVCFLSVLGKLGASLQPTDALALADALHEAFKGFRV